MSTIYTTSEIAEFNYTISYASYLPAGYGHKKISVEVVSENGERKEFSSITNDMSSFDEATDLEGQQQYEALFELVENNLDGQIAEWIYLLD